MMIGHLNSLQISQLTNCVRLVQAILIAVSNNPFNRCFVDISTISKFLQGALHIIRNTICRSPETLLPCITWKDITILNIVINWAAPPSPPLHVIL